MPDAGTSKRQLRDMLRERRRAMEPDLRLAASEQLAHQICSIPDWERLRHIACYVAADGEIDPRPLMQNLLREGKFLYLPRLADDFSLVFSRWTPSTRMIPNRYGIPEPPANSAARTANALDALLMPLVGWCRNGQRLGMGGGYYDRSLAGVEGVVKIGLAYAAQECESFPAEAWDVNLDFVVTESGLHCCSKQQG